MDVQFQPTDAAIACARQESDLFLTGDEPPVARPVTFKMDSAGHTVTADPTAHISGYGLISSTAKVAHEPLIAETAKVSGYGEIIPHDTLIAEVVSGYPSKSLLSLLDTDRITIQAPREFTLDLEAMTDAELVHIVHWLIGSGTLKFYGDPTELGVPAGLIPHVRPVGPVQIYRKD